MAFEGTACTSDSKLASPDLTAHSSEIYDVFDPYLDSDSAVLGLYHLLSISPFSDAFFNYRR